MMNIKGNVLTDKGVVKAGARKALVDYVAKNPNIFATAERNENGTYTVDVTDDNGNTIYINFEVTVSTMNAGLRAPRKSKAKATAPTTFDVE